MIYSRLCLIAFLAAAAPAQPLKFDVASVKEVPDLATLRAAGKMPHTGFTVSGTRVDIGGITMLGLLINAYGMKGYQIVGPAWLTTRNYDVLATMPAGATKEQLPELFRSLLEERFHLAAHIATSERPVYALVIGRSGSKIRESSPDDDTSACPPEKWRDQADGTRSCSNLTGIGTANASLSSVTMGGPFGTARISVVNGVSHNEYSKMTMKQLAEVLSANRDVGLPVIDKTGLAGSWHVVLETAVPGNGVSLNGAPIGSPPANPPETEQAAAPTSGSIFAAVEKLGLKLEKTKGPVEQLIVDDLNRTPTGN